MVPVVAGIWQQHEIWDGTYDFDDLLDAHEMLYVREENRRRAQAAAKTYRSGRTLTRIRLILPRARCPS